MTSKKEKLETKNTDVIKRFHEGVKNLKQKKEDSKMPVKTYLSTTKPRSIWTDFFSDFSVRDLENRIGTSFLIDHLTLDYEDTENEFIFSLDIPGVEKEDLKVELVDNILSLSAIRKDGKKEKKIDRSWMIKDINQLDLENITSSLKNGVLKITIPKIEEKKNTIQIEIK